jgi:hypothetical protein
MAEPIKISRIFSPEDAIARVQEYGHLYEVLQPPEGLVNFKPRDGFPAGGTLLVGDLICNESQTSNLEIHPFPEWVLQSPRYGKHPGKAYAIFANVDPKFFERKISRKDWTGRVQAYNDYLKTLPVEDFFAIAMPPGTIIKVCKNAPHFFLSSQATGEDFPYLVVFEPEIPVVAEELKAATAYFSLPNPLKIE